MPDKKKNGLGRGLDSLFGTDVSQLMSQIENGSQDFVSTKQDEIPVDKIQPNPYQPRKEFDQKALEDLAKSIQEHGIFTPLLVIKRRSDYQLVAGERRLRAAKMAHLEKVPVIIVDFNDEQMMEISLLENIQREDLSPLEEAFGFQTLMNKLDYTQEKLAERVGKSRAYCANILRLLKLPPEVQSLLKNQELTVGHVRPLLTLQDENEMIRLAHKMVNESLSVREAEKLCAKGADDKKPLLVKVKKDPQLMDIQNQMSRKLGTKVELSHKKISISYEGNEDLNRILALLHCLDQE
ncbi:MULTISPECIES: ParB/RepB/Spo0J family partition protein [Terrabacteria group]|uniref:ParB/RepB/Spo0J family partition protein n=1 Tax=Bacillati TaxID=1783272 RepID=UPI001939CF7A|nr:MULTISPECIES: ParB/RepB/Spo0J family partition protein [Terrabacteria group]MBW9212486.1 ParB/RepB/Spo0J family partition protein [Trueperella sp. zg.1013]QRG86758.1 ParB/RepB/Spo0J family partition protein [Bulleidia sp. zg-1006]